MVKKKLIVLVGLHHIISNCASMMTDVMLGTEVIGSAKHLPCPRTVFISLLRRFEVRSDMLNTNFLHALSRDAHNGHYGVPVSVRQVTGSDMGGEFRIGFLNHATFEVIDSGKRVFVECTWNLGKKDENDERRLTNWYEWRENDLHPVDSMLWSTDEDLNLNIDDKNMVQSHPENGYLIVAGLLLLWLFGVIMGWKWTYQTNSWGQNTLREILGEGMYRFCIGAILAIAIGITLYLFYVSGK